MEYIRDPIGSVRDFLDALAGKTCWAVIAGSGTGSTISFKLGKKIQRKRPLSNSKLSLEVREFDSEFTVFVKGGARWTVESCGSIICSNDDSNEDGGAMVYGLSLLTGKTVVSAKSSEDFFEVAFMFDDGLSFQMSCSAVGMTGYILLYGDEVIAVVGGHAQ